MERTSKGRIGLFISTLDFTTYSMKMYEAVLLEPKKRMSSPSYARRLENLDDLVSQKFGPPPEPPLAKTCQN